mmetsp:Transcript_26321/g.62503  ORF Transcript_26321/g.62503 Transcript_26321/m.62503 type:complete len:225 (+) Transcript_26321:2107-2781(+)
MEPRSPSVVMVSFPTLLSSPAAAAARMAWALATDRPATPPPAKVGMASTTLLMPRSCADCVANVETLGSSLIAFDVSTVMSSSMSSSSSSPSSSSSRPWAGRWWCEILSSGTWSTTFPVSPTVFVVFHVARESPSSAICTARFVATDAIPSGLVGADGWGTLSTIPPPPPPSPYPNVRTSSLVANVTTLWSSGRRAWAVVPPIEALSFLEYGGSLSTTPSGPGA